MSSSADQDEETARKYLEGQRWPSGPICPECNSGALVGKRPNGYYRCYACDKFTFTVRTGTILERSHIPLHKWVKALKIIDDYTRMTSYALSEQLGITQKSAWFMLSRLRQVCSSPDSIDKLSGAVGLDRTIGVVLAHKPKPKTKAAKRRLQNRRRDEALVS